MLKSMQIEIELLSGAGTWMGIHICVADVGTDCARIEGNGDTPGRS